MVDSADSVFKIPIFLNETSTCSIKLNIKEAQILLKTKLIIWDKASMTHSHAFVAVRRLICSITKCQEPFGVKVILLSGDFREVLLVILRGRMSLTVASCLKKHPFWSNFTKLTLSVSMRALKSEKEFSKWLLDVANAK